MSPNLEGQMIEINIDPELQNNQTGGVFNMRRRNNVNVLPAANVASGTSTSVPTASSTDANVASAASTSVPAASSTDANVASAASTSVPAASSADTGVASASAPASVSDIASNLTNIVKNLNIDNASIILNINKINILFGDDNTSKFFYILDKGIRPLLKIDENIDLNNNTDAIIDNILRELSLSELSSSASETSASGGNDINDLIKEQLRSEINKYEELNIKKYLFLLLEPGLLNNKDNIKAIFEQFDAIKFTYNNEDGVGDENLAEDNRNPIDSFGEYITTQDTPEIKYKKFVFLLLKIIEKIIETELGDNALQGLYAGFDLIKPEEVNLDENIKTTKMAYANIKQSLDDTIIDKIIENINKLNKIPKYKTIGYYINFNGFKTGDGQIGKINLIKMLIFLLYNIDNKHDGFLLDQTSFATIFNSNKKDDDIDPILDVGNITQEAKDAIAAYNTSMNAPPEPSQPSEPIQPSQPSEPSQSPVVSGTEGNVAPETPSSGGKKIRTQKSRRKPKKNKTR